MKQLTFCMRFAAGLLFFQLTWLAFTSAIAADKDEIEWLNFSPFVARKVWAVSETNVCSVPAIGLLIHNGWHKPIVFNRHFLYVSIVDSAGTMMAPGYISPAQEPAVDKESSAAHIVLQPGKVTLVEWPVNYSLRVHVGSITPDQVTELTNRTVRTIHVPSFGEYRLRLLYNCQQHILRMVNPTTGAVMEHNVWHGSVELPPVPIQIRQGCDIACDPVAYDRICEFLGSIGCFVVRTDERWEQIKTLFQRYTGHASMDDSSVPSPDFSREMIVAYFLGCDAADRLVVSNAVHQEKRWTIDFDLLEAESRAFVPQWKLTGIVLPTESSVIATVPNLYPLNTSRTSTTTRIEWHMEDGWGDVADGLQSQLLVSRTSVKQGEDIVVSMLLRCVAPATGAVYVWDNKYSYGYRNDSYYVTRPNGRKQIFQRPVIEGWDKNVPRPVAIESGTSWVLGGWSKGEAIRKSLRMLGLDTSLPGIYTIYGVFNQEAKKGMDLVSPQHRVRMWGGSIATAPVTVKVE